MVTMCIGHINTHRMKQGVIELNHPVIFYRMIRCTQITGHPGDMLNKTAPIIPHFKIHMGIHVHGFIITDTIQNKCHLWLLIQV